MKITIAQLIPSGFDIDTSRMRKIIQENPESDLIVFSPGVGQDEPRSLSIFADLKEHIADRISSVIASNQIVSLLVDDDSSVLYFNENEEYSYESYYGCSRRFEHSGLDVSVIFHQSPMLRDDPHVFSSDHDISVRLNSLKASAGQETYAGGSFVAIRGEPSNIRLPVFEEAVVTFDTDDLQPAERPVTDTVKHTYDAIVFSIRQYCRNAGLSKIVLGASGGIDSALVLTMAADAIGGENVIGISMPSRFSSEHSKDDARELMENLGGTFMEVPINEFHESMSATLGLSGVADENLQARIRGMVVMGVANKEGALVLQPGNKSEASVGYCTMYGDTVGGYAPLCDVFKTDVYELARYRNSLPDAPIPVSSIEKKPSAELSEDQFDTDSLPDYETLDGILREFIQRVPQDDGSGVVNSVLRKYVASEWKRRQMAGGPIFSYPYVFTPSLDVTVEENMRALIGGNK